MLVIRCCALAPICLCIALWATPAFSQTQASLYDQACDALYLDRDQAKAYTLFDQSARSGDPRAMLGLSQMLMEGQGVAQDETLGVRWLQQSASAGNPQARTRLGIYLLQGDHGLAVDPQQAFQLLSSAAQQNDCTAALTLATAYRAGIGTQPDPKTSNQWLAWARQNACNDNIAMAPSAPAMTSTQVAPQPSNFTPSPTVVAGVQQGLTNLGYNPGPVDGIYGSRTAQAIQSFQSRQGMAVDGAITPLLIERLNQALSKR